MQMGMGMGKIALIGLMCTLVLLGCAKEPPPPETPPPPPEPTPEEIAADIRKNLEPMERVFNGGGEYDISTKDAMIGALTTARSTNQVKENGRQAIAMVSHDIEEIVRKARDKRRWRMVLVAIEAYDALQPGGEKFNRIKELALLQVNRPKVQVQGFFEDKEANNQVYAFLEVFDPATGATSRVRVREGEEFNGLKFTRIVGDLQGVELEYLAIPGELFEVLK